MTSVETSEEVADQPTYQARVSVAYDHSIGLVEERRAKRHRDFEKSLKRNGYRVSLASITLAAALGAWSIPCASQDGGRPSVRNVAPPKVIRTHRLRITDDFFKQEAVRFERTRVDMSGSILADGHKLNLYGAVLVRRDKICATAEGARWACGQRAFIALRNLLEGKSIIWRFKHVMGPAKGCGRGRGQQNHPIPTQQGVGRAGGQRNRGELRQTPRVAQEKEGGYRGSRPAINPSARATGSYSEPPTRRDWLG